MDNSSQLSIIVRARNEASQILKQVQKDTEGLGRSVKKSLEDAVGPSRMFAAGLAAVGASLGGFVGFGAKVAGELESARQGFVTLLGSAQEADKIMDRIKQEAMRTPFEITGLTQATQMLAAVTHNGDRALDFILDIGESLAAMGKGNAELDRISVNLQQIAANGRAFGMDIRQFAFAGIPIYEMLQEKIGLTGEALNEFIEGGGVTFDLLESMFDQATAAGGRFEGAFKNQAGTFNQLVSNMKDTFKIFASDLVKQTGAFDLLKKAIGGLSDFMVRNKENIIGGIMTFVNFIRENAPLVIGIIVGALIPALYGIATAIWGILAPLAPFILAGAAIAFMLDQLAQKVGGWSNLLNIARDAVAAVWNVLSSLLGPSLKALWNTISQSLLPALKRLWEMLEPVLIPVLKVLGVLLAGTLLAGVWVFINVINIAVTVLSTLVNWLSNVVQWLKNVWHWFGSVFGGLKDLVANAVRGIYDIFIAPFARAFDFIRDIPGRIANSLGNVGQILRDKIGDWDIPGPLGKVRDVIPGFATGGFTGRGGMNEVAGVVHKGEYVIPKSQVDQNSGLPKMAAGGGNNVYNLSVNVGTFMGSELELQNLAVKLQQLLQQAMRAQNTTNVNMIRG